MCQSLVMTVLLQKRRRTNPVRRGFLEVLARMDLVQVTSEIRESWVQP